MRASTDVGVVNLPNDCPSFPVKMVGDLKALTDHLLDKGHQKLMVMYPALS